LASVFDACAVFDNAFAAGVCQLLQMPLAQKDHPKYVLLPSSSDLRSRAVLNLGRILSIFSDLYRSVLLCVQWRLVATLRLASSELELDLSNSWFWNAPQFAFWWKAIDPLLWEG
jgi:hypothetical protein